jgi:hypothetical protein
VGTVAGDAALDAVVAHGLLSSVAVMHSAALTLGRLGDAVPTDDRTFLLESMCLQSDLLVEGTDCLTRCLGDEIVSSATAVRLAAGTLAVDWDRVVGEDRADLLAILDRHGDRLKTMLLQLVQGLDPEAILLLDSLSSSPR